MKQARLKNGVILDIVASDGAFQLVPLLFVHCASEDTYGWEFTFKTFVDVYGDTNLVKGGIHEELPEGVNRLGVYSDHNQSLMHAIQRFLKYASKGYCLEHRMVSAGVTNMFQSACVSPTTCLRLFSAEKYLKYV